MRVGECKQRQESNSSSGSNSGSSLLLLFYFIFSLSNYNFYSTSMHDTMGFVRHQQTQVQNVSNCNFYNFYTTGMYDTAGFVRHHAEMGTICTRTHYGYGVKNPDLRCTHDEP